MHWIGSLLLLTSCSFFQETKWKTPYFFGEDCDNHLGTYSEQKILNWKTKQAWKIYWHASAPTACPAPRYPALGIHLDSAQAWIYIVVSSAPRNLKERIPMVIVQTSPENLKQGVPFYSEGNIFKHNPLWPTHDALLRTLNLKAHEWKGYIFPVRIRRQTIIPLGGLEWGFYRQVGSASPSMLPLRPVPFEKWKEFLPRLNNQFSNWYFHDNIYQILD